MPRIDAHQHFWQPARGDYGWLAVDDPVLVPLQRDFLPADLAPILRAHDVTGTVLVQAAPSVAETEFMLALAARHDFVEGVVGWIDLASDAAPEQIAQLAAQPAFKGVRPMLQDLPDVDWVAHAPRPEAVRALLAHGLRLDALVKPPNLPALRSFVAAWPQLPVVIDHAAKPPLSSAWEEPAMQAWRRDMAALAAHPQVACKLSGLLTEMAPADRTSCARILERLRPVADALLAWFGPRRLMWGSDWPVLTLAAGYDEWLAVADALLAPLSIDERVQVQHGTARRFYGLH
jgi:L-fuconolactonase